MLFFILLFARDYITFLLIICVQVPAPVRFVFVLLGPVGYAARYREVGRAFATLMSDDVGEK